VPLLVEIVKARSKGDWMAALEAVQVPCGPINNLAEVFDDPQVRARSMTVSLPHPLSEHGLRVVASPIKLSATPVQYRRSPPLLGQHTDEVLGELGLAAGEIAGLRGQGIV